MALSTAMTRSPAALAVAVTALIVYPLPAAAQGFSFLCATPYGPCVDIRNDEQMTPFAPIAAEEDIWIVNPLPDRQFSFDSDDPGVLRIRARAVTSPPVLQPGIEWEMESIGDADVEITPSHGPEVEIVVRGLPEWNGQFGPKTITAWVEGSTGRLSAQVTVKIFFPPMARNNPHGGEPNWFYYWRQTDANQGITGFVHRTQPEGRCPGNAVPAGRYIYDADRIELYDALAELGCRVRWGGDRAWAIDCFAETLRHEQRHREEMREWWDARSIGPRDCAPTSEDLGTLSGLRSFARMAGGWTIDWDGDMVPDDVEEQVLGCDVRDPASCWGRPSDDVLDMEMNAYRAGWTWGLGSADDEDWSACGKQWRYWDGGSCRAQPPGS